MVKQPDILELPDNEAEINTIIRNVGKYSPVHSGSQRDTSRTISGSIPGGVTWDFFP